jgi:hypothetical protein
VSNEKRGVEKKESQVEAALAYLSTNISAAGANMEHLVGRLEKILSSIGPQTTEEPKEADVVPLAATIHKMAHLVGVLAAHINDTAQRVEL